MLKPVLSLKDTHSMSKEELIAEVERLQFYIDTTMDLSYEWVADQDLITVSENLANFLGLDQRENARQILLDAIHPDHRDSHRATMISHFKNHRKRALLEYQIRNQYGDYNWVSENGVAMRDTNNRVIRYVATLTDISTRKLAEDGLLESNARSLAIMENTSSPISLKDMEGRFVLVNDIFCIKQGFKRHDVIGKTAFDLYSKKNAEAEAQRDQEVLKSLKPIPFEMTTTDPDGTIHTFISDRFPIFSAENEIIGVGSVNTDITERKQMEAALRASEQEMRMLAATDPLTGARNRRSFFEIGNRELARSNRYNRPLTVLMVDIDHFKKLNDTYGHAAGDLVLKNFARECIRTLREQDTLGRLGGEEFAIILPEINQETAIGIAERLRENLMNLKSEIDDDVLTFTVSIGVGQCKPEDTTIDAALDLADSAMYRAKQTGRNRVAAGT